MKTIVFFLEGPSEKAFLEGLIPRILPNDVYCQYRIFQGKQDLENNPEANTSHSFNIFLAGIRKLVGSPITPITSTIISQPL